MKERPENQNDANFLEEFQGLDMAQAIKEAKRCLQCKKPSCIEGCPINNKIPEFIGELAKGNLGYAREYLAQKSNLPAVCGRVCAHEKQCEGHCVLNAKGKPIRIGLLERFVADFDSDMKLIRDPLVPKSRGNVAVIGSGPAGLTVAGDLAREGFNIVVYEAESEPGGILLYGIPAFRLPREIVKKEIDRIAALGVTFRTNCVIGEDMRLDDLLENGMDAVFIGTGTALAKDLPLPGHELDGIIQAIYYLRMITLFNEEKIDRHEVPIYEGEDVVVIGAGNVAMDGARSAMRTGANSVTVTYRGTKDTMPALKHEYEGAIKDGVDFLWETSPIEYVGENGCIKGLKVSDGNGNEKILKASKVMVAIGSRPAKRIVSTTEGIEVSDRGFVLTKDRPYGMTTLRGVFAGGDVVHQPATVVLAMKEAKKVAAGIAAYVDAKKLLGM